MIEGDRLGAHPRRDASAQWHVDFAIPLPGITPRKGYQLKVRIIHERDQFIRMIEPVDFDLGWQTGTTGDLWQATVPIFGVVRGHFGAEGRYLYRYQLLRDGQVVTLWFADPFGRATGIGGLSAFDLDSAASPFPWTDGAFVVPEVDAMVVYELHVGEFNSTFDGVVAQVDYLHGLGVNVLELMPITDVKEQVEWGYTPLGYFSPDERFGGGAALKRMVDACHQRGIAVILDAVYAHAHPEFAYNLVYQSTGEANPMMGYFAGEFFDTPGMDYTKEFTRDYFAAVNRWWIEEYHFDGFRYDYVPGMYDGPVGVGYAQLVYHTYQNSMGTQRFARPDGSSRIIQCAEHLPDPKGILKQTYTNTAWQNWLLDKARDMARWRYVDDKFAHILDPEFLGHARTFENAGDAFPVAPFQYIESHDYGRFINRFGTESNRDLLGQSVGERDLFYKTQPYVIALYTGKGVPMIWQGQEFGENWDVPNWGIGRNLFARPLHWEYFYDRPGRALVRLYRILGSLRRAHPALGSRSHYYYYYNEDHLRQGVIAYLREESAGVGEAFVVVLNFSEEAKLVWLPFPRVGTWAEQIDGAATVTVPAAGQWTPVIVTGNYGAVYLHQAG